MTKNANIHFNKQCCKLFFAWDPRTSRKGWSPKWKRMAVNLGRKRLGPRPTEGGGDQVAFFIERIIIRPSLKKAVVDNNTRAKLLRRKNPFFFQSSATRLCCFGGAIVGTLCFSHRGPSNPIWGCCTTMRTSKNHIKTSSPPEVPC